MTDNWLNVGYEGDHLLPYQEPEQAVQNPLLGKLNSLSLILAASCGFMNCLSFTS